MGFPPAGAGFINSGRRNKFYIRLCALLLFQTRALGTVDISDGRVLVTKRSVDLSQSLVRDVGGPISLSPRRDTPRCLSPSLAHPRLYLSLPYSPLRLIYSSSFSSSFLLARRLSLLHPSVPLPLALLARNIKISTISVVAAKPVA